MWPLDCLQRHWNSPSRNRGSGCEKWVRVELAVINSLETATAAWNSDPHLVCAQSLLILYLNVADGQLSHSPVHLKFSARPPSMAAGLPLPWQMEGTFLMPGLPVQTREDAVFLLCTPVLAACSPCSITLNISCLTWFPNLLTACSPSQL